MAHSQQETIERIMKSAQDLSEVVDSIPKSMINSKPADKEWSIFEIAVHVRNVAMFVYGLRIRRLITENDPLFANYDEESDRLNDMKKSQPVEDVVEMNAAEHRAIGKILSLLSEEAWERSGRHRQSGQLSIDFLAMRLAAHAEEHIEQMKDTHRTLSSKAK